MTKPSLLIPTDKNYTKNIESFPCKESQQSCIICGRPCKNPKYYLWIHLGGNHVVTTAEGERLNANGKSGSDLGLHPIGPDCLKKHPELKNYLEK